jgi:hypothetical protein
MGRSEGKGEGFPVGRNLEGASENHGMAFGELEDGPLFLDPRSFDLVAEHRSHFVEAQSKPASLFSGQGTEARFPRVQSWRAWVFAIHGFSDLHAWIQPVGQDGFAMRDRELVLSGRGLPIGLAVGTGRHPIHAEIVRTRGPLPEESEAEQVRIEAGLVAEAKMEDYSSGCEVV